MAEETRNAYGNTLAQLIVKDKNIVVLDADLSKSTKTNLAKKACSERHFNAGIAESNMLGMAAGLAASGKTVFASSFAVFATGRAFEIIRNSICYPKLNVKICATHAGLSVGEDGASHQAIEDIAIMRSLPNMKVYIPCDQYETNALINYIAQEKGPCYVRLGRGKVDDVYNEHTIFDFTKPNILRQGKDIVLFATGLMVQEALKAGSILEEKGIECTVIDIACLKPLNTSFIVQEVKKHNYAYALEEHNIIGGLYGSIAEAIAPYGLNKSLVPIGVNDTFGESGKARDVLYKYGLTAEHIIEVVNGTYQK